MIFEKVVITDDPATWPKEGEFTYMDEDMAAKFRRNDPYCFVDSWWLKPIDLDAKYKEWCKATGRNGGILVHGSIQEFFKWLKEEDK